MTNSIFAEQQVKEQKLNFEIDYPDEYGSVCSSFNFDIEALPLKTVLLNDRTLDDPLSGMVLNLRCGHIIQVVEFNQFSSQDGVYEGYQHPLSSFAQALRKAKVLFPCFVGVPKGLAPVLHRSAEGSSYSWIATPPVCTVALFTSPMPVVDPESSGSAAVFIWFQDSFGLDLPPQVRRQIEDSDWESFAVDQLL
jgi:hypothetical protein